jgi:hypothetical protein
MFERFKQKARRRSFENILDLLASLAEASNRANKDIQNSGDSTPADKALIIRLQNDLLIQLCGPLPLDRIKTDFIEPLLAGSEMTEGARLAVEHVLREFDKRRIIWSKADYDAYEELLAEYRERHDPDYQEDAG